MSKQPIGKLRRKGQEMARVAEALQGAGAVQAAKAAAAGAVDRYNQQTAKKAPQRQGGSTLQAATDALSKAAGGQKQPAGFDMDKYKAIVSSMMGIDGGYTREQAQLMAQRPEAQVIPLQEAAPALYDQQREWEATGGAKPAPVFDDYMRKLIEAQGGLAAENLAVRDARVAAGQAPYTAEELAEFMDAGRIMGTTPRGEMTTGDRVLGGVTGLAGPVYGQVLYNLFNSDPMSTAKVMTNFGGITDQVDAQYAMALNDQAAAMLYGAYDNVESLVNGNMPYMSTEYLTALMPALAEAAAEEDARVQAQIDSGALQLAADMSDVPMADVREFVEGFYYPEDGDILGELAWMYEQNHDDEATAQEALAADLEQMLMLDAAINGSPVTLEQLMAMDGAEQDAVMQRVVDTYKTYALDTGYREMGYKYPYAALMENVQAELDSRAALENFMPDILADETAADYFGYIENNAQGQGAELYRLINGTGSDNPFQYYGIDFDLLTEQEKWVYNYYYNTGNAARAQEYFDALKATLMVRARNRDMMLWSHMATRDALGAVGSFALARGTNLVSPIVAMGEMATELITGEEAPVTNWMLEYGNAVTQAQRDTLGEAGGPKLLGQTPMQWAYSTGATVMDMGLAIAMGRKIGPMVGLDPNKATLLLMSGEAGAHKWAELSGEGRSTLEKVALAAGQGLVEYISEKTPLDIITGKTGGKGLMRWLLAGGVEGAEEIVAALGEKGLDKLAAYLTGKRDKDGERELGYQLLGVTNARELVHADTNLEMAQQGLQGFFAGGVLGGVNQGTEAVGDYTTGRAIRNNNQGGANALLDFAALMGAKSDAAKMAETLRSKAEKGKVSSREIGRLFRQLMTETPQKYANEIEEMGVAAVEQALVDSYEQMGDNLQTTLGDRYKAGDIAREIVRTNGERSQLMKSMIGKFILTHRGTKQIAEEYSGGEVEWAAQLQERRTEKGMQGMTEMARLAQMTQKRTATESKPTAEAVKDNTTDEEIETITGRIEPHAGMPRAVVMSAEDGTTTEGSLVRVERSGEQLNLVLTQEGAEEEITVPLEEGVNVPDAGLAQVLAYARTRKWVEASEINEMMQLALETQLPAASVVAAYEAGVNAGFAGETAPTADMIADKLTPEQAQTAMEVIKAGMAAGMAQAQAAEVARTETVQARRAAAPVTGSVAYIGAVTTTEEAAQSKVRQKIKGLRSRLTTEQAAAVDAMGQLAKVLGIRVVLYESTGEKGEQNTVANGWFNRDTNEVFLDLNSGINRFGEAAQYTILTTAAHELTHYIEATSQEGYAQLRQAARELLAQKGSYADMVLSELRASKMIRTRAEGESETIAEACEMMLRDSKAMRTLASRHMGLAAKVAKFINDFTRRVRRALTGVTGQSPEAMALINSAGHYAQELQTAWDQALIEAANLETQKTVVKKSARVGAQTDIAPVAVDTGETATQTETGTTRTGAQADIAPVAVDAEETAAETETKTGTTRTGAQTDIAPVAYTQEEAMTAADQIAATFTDPAQSAAASIALATVLGSVMQQGQQYNRLLLNGAVAHAVQTMSLDAAAQESVAKAVEAKATEMIREEPKPIAMDVAGDVTEEVQAAVEEAGTEITAEVVPEMVQEMAEAAVQTAVEAMAQETVQTEAATETQTAAVQYSVRPRYLPAMIEAAESVAEEIYVGTDEATGALLKQVAETVARAAEERVTWEQAVAEARERQYSFAGRRSETMDEGLLNDAMARLNAGEDAETVRQETGWFRGMDGKWRYEIDDSMAVVNRDIPNTYSVLEDVLEHEELYAAYPFLRYVAVDVQQLPAGERANAEGAQITINSDYLNSASEMDLMETLLHEVQHVVQTYEGFARGSNPAYWAQQVQEARAETQMFDPEDEAYLRENGFEEWFRQSMRELHEGTKDVPQHFADMDAWKADLLKRRVRQYLLTKLGGNNDGHIRRLNNELREMLDAQTPEMQELMRQYVRTGNALNETEDAVEEYRIFAELDALEKKAGKEGTKTLREYASLQRDLRSTMDNNRPRNAVELYRQTAGEIEARDTSARATMDARTRRMTPPAADPDAVFVEGVQYSERTEADMEMAKLGIQVDSATQTAYVQMSERTWRASDYVTKREEMAAQLAKKTGVTPQKAEAWIDSVTGIANIIASNRSILDYVPSKFSSPYKSNPEYGGTIDMSTLCPKRALATATLDAIQRIIGDNAMTREDFVRIRKMMQEKGYEVACGLCFVESSRANMSKYVQEFIDGYRRKNPGAEVTMPMLNTVEGLEETRENNYALYEAFESYMNKLAQRKPKLFEKRSEYTDEILRAFINDTRVEDKNMMGGMRIQSFSDFEVIHLIDMMQVITDMATVGLAGQAYTKQPNFARALGNTGLKINLSLIAKDVTTDGQLVFDPVEGMEPNVAFDLREQYSKNVGTIVVVFTDAQLKAAMAHPQVDFIIPFHRSQWKKSDYAMLGLPAKTKDYTLHQNERHRWKDEKGKWHTTKLEEGNYLPNKYWDFNLSGKENAQVYLDMCNAEGRIPKFPFLLDNKGGKYQLKADGSTDGYWKLLIDFKMYDNDGVGSPQMPVRPDFNIEEAEKMLRAYKGGHDSVKPAQDVVEEYVAEYMRRDTRLAAGFRGLDVGMPGVQFSERRNGTPAFRETLLAMEPTADMTETEKELLAKYKELVRAYQDKQSQVEAQRTLAEVAEREYEALKTTPARDEYRKQKNRLDVLQSQLRRASDALYNAEKRTGFADLMNRYRLMVQTFHSGKNQQEAAKRLRKRLDDVERMLSEMESDNDYMEVYEQVGKAKRDAWRVGTQAQKAAEKVAKYHEQLERHARLLAERENLQKMNDLLKGKVQEWFDERELMEKRRSLLGDIRRKYDWMDKRIRRQTDKKHIPEALKPTVDEAIRVMLDANDVLQIFPAKQAAAMREVYEKLKALHGSNLQQANDLVVEAIDDQVADLRKKLQVANAAEGLDKLREGAENYAGTTDIKGRTERMTRQIEVLQTIKDVTDMIWHAIDKADTVIIAGQERKIADVTGKLTEELEAKGDYRYSKVVGKAMELAKLMVRKGNMTPPYFFRLLGLGTLTELNDSFVRAQLEHETLLERAKAKILELKQQYHYDNWANADKLEIETWQGREAGKTRHKIQLTADEALALWATWKRETGGSTPVLRSYHLELGGFTLAHGTREDGKYIVTDKTPHKLSKGDMARIDAWLTEDMKQYADAVVDYMSNEAAEWGNEISMQLFGIRKFTESYYFPMRVDQRQLQKSSKSGTPDPETTNRVAAMSSAKERTPDATKALEISGFTDMASRHLTDMVLYASFAIPIESFNTVLNQSYTDGPVTEQTQEERNNKEATPESTMLMRGLLEQKIGKDLYSYLTQYIADLNGGLKQAARDTAGNKLISVFKKSAVVGSLAVAMQQMSAIVRAAYVLPMRYLRLPGNPAKEWQELTKYSGAAKVKDRGGFDMASSRSVADYIAGKQEDSFEGLQKAGALLGLGFEGGAMERVKGAGRSWDNLLSLPPQAMDKLTWSIIWQAVKAETAGKNPGMDTGSEAFLQMAGRRFDEVANLTQVYDSTLVRSEMMRSKALWAKAITAFAAEPTLTANMLLDAVATKSPKTISKAAAIYLIAQVVNAALAALIKAGRDDDKDKPWLEKYLDSMGSQLGGWSGALNPAGLLPLVRDFMSLFDGFDVERSDMTAFANIIKEFTNAFSGKYKDTPWKYAENVAGSLASAFGIPLKNVLRDARTLYNTFVVHPFGDQRDISGMSLMHDASHNYVLLPDRDNEYYFDRLYEAMDSGDKEDVAEVRGFLEDVLGKKPTAIDTGIRNAVKERFMAGVLTEKEAMDYLLKHGLADDEKDAYKYVDKWREAPDHEDDEDYSYSQYNNVYEAIDAGNMSGINAAVKELKEHGFLEDKGTLKSTLRSKYRDMYRDLYKTNKTKFANLQAALVAALVASGVPRGEALEYVKGWLKDTEADKAKAKKTK